MSDPVEEAEERQARSLLENNGVGLDPPALRAALEPPMPHFQAAAARLLGAAGDEAARDALARLAGDGAVEESARAQAAYALARLGDPAGAERLRELLAEPWDSSPGPLQAAGHLARLDDPAGFAIVEEALGDANPVIAMIAVKQLAPFARLQERRPEGAPDARALLERTLSHPDEQVAREARILLDRLS